MSLLTFLRKPICLLATAVAVPVLAASIAYGDEEKFVTPAMLLDVLATQDIDNIRSTLGSVRKMRYKGEVLPILKDVWEDNKKKYSNLDWPTLQKPIVRAELANILAQAWQNGVINLNPAEVHLATVKLLETNDLEVRLIALQTLEVFDSEEDVDTIATFARKGEMGTFQMAVSTLTLMCNPSAEKAVLQLISDTREKDSQNFIKETKAKTDSFKKKTSLCSSKKRLSKQKQRGTF